MTATAMLPASRIAPSFVLAGRAIFTVSNPQGDRYTFKVTAKASDPARPAVYFLALLTGPNNDADYTYVGMVDARSGEVRLTAKSRLTDDSLPVKVARWALSLLWTGRTLPAGYAIHHEGKCGRCGRLLTVPESIESGLGPECIQKMGLGFAA